MTFFMGFTIRTWKWAIVLILGFASTAILPAQTETNADLPGPGQIALEGTNTVVSVTLDTNAPAANPPAVPASSTPSLS